MRRWAAELGWPTLCTSLVLILAAWYPIDNPDTFGHLAAGRQIAELGHVPRLDTFSYFRDSPRPWVNYEWLSDFVFYASFRAGGYAGLHALRALVLAALAGVLVATAWLRAGPLAAQLCPAIVLLTLPAVRFRLSVRPHLFGMLFAAAYVFGLCQLLRGSGRVRYRWVAALGIAHVAWINLHGSHLLGLLLVGLAWFTAPRDAEARRPLTLLLAWQAIACCISPYGPAIVTGALQHTFDPAYRALIEEWQAWRPTRSFWLPVIVGVQALALVLTARALPRDVLRNFSLAAALVLLLMAARSVRFMADFLLLTAPTLAAALTPTLSRLAARQLRIVITAALLAGSVWSIAICRQVQPYAAFGGSFSTRGRPLGSAQWLAAHWPDARIMAVMADGWDLMFSLPQAKFLLDGRAPFYGPEHVRRVQSAWGSPPHLRALLEATSTNVVIVRPLVTEQQPALRALLAAPDFRLVSIEAEHCVFARIDGKHATQVENAALQVLRPSYALDWLARSDAEEVRAELARLPAHPNVQPYRAWVRGMLTARPLLRAGNAGLAAPATAAERTLARAALRELREADRQLPRVPSVMAYHALLAVTACELDEARAAFARLAAEETTRELLLGQEELALREGERERVREFVHAARADRAAAGDAWIAALEVELAAPPPCAAASN